MITDFFILVLTPLIALFFGLLSLIVSAPFMTPVFVILTPLLQWVSHIMRILQPLIPFQTQLNLLNIYIGYYVLLWNIRLFSWILRKIPFMGLS